MINDIADSLKTTSHAASRPASTMRSHDAMQDDDAVAAGWAATRGAGVGALKYGAAMAVLAAVGQKTSPLYRGLTIQFKVYIQMSGMVLGSMIEADHQLRVYEAELRQQRRIMRHQARMRALQDDDDDGD
ncbi:hypothetical protein SPI_05572 [Niveomyces insectorum RCEF 264]|uniref:Imidazoleglycerol-phosphate dehydratase n=1 Tax=Niveomyces insectorum RCEF 264 TaxID=1081102 RepID=A0A167TCA6_9HYPO|nr:hypothetical protein SPI_05572 [Niveomyces insectorum RCEF 264]